MMFSVWELRFWFGLLRRLVVRDLAPLALSPFASSWLRWYAYHEQETEYRHVVPTAQVRPRNIAVLDLPEEFITSYRYNSIRQRYLFKQMVVRNDIRALKHHTWRLPEAIGLYIPFRYRQSSRMLSWVVRQLFRPYLQPLAKFGLLAQTRLRAVRRFRLRPFYTKSGYTQSFYLLRGQGRVRGYIRALKGLYLRLRHLYLVEPTRMFLPNYQTTFTTTTAGSGQPVCFLSDMVWEGGSAYPPHVKLAFASPIGAHYLPRALEAWLYAKFPGRISQFYQIYRRFLNINTLKRFKRTGYVDVIAGGGGVRSSPLWFSRLALPVFYPSSSSSFLRFFTEWSEQRNAFHFALSERAFGSYPDLAYTLLVRRPRPTSHGLFAVVSPISPPLSSLGVGLLCRTAESLRGSLTGLLTQGTESLCAWTLSPFVFKGGVSCTYLAARMFTPFSSYFSRFFPLSSPLSRPVSPPGRIVLTLNSNTLFLTVVDALGQTLVQTSTGVIRRLARLARRRRPSPSSTAEDGLSST